MTNYTDLCARLRAPSYWMSGSSDGHEGENDAPRQAADAIEALQSQLATVLAREAETTARYDARLDRMRRGLSVAVSRLIKERDEARAFISDVVHMQSGGGWTRAAMREAAADFLANSGVKPLFPKDTTPAFVLAAEAKAEVARLREALVKERNALRAKLTSALGALDESYLILAAAFNRIHGLPRTTDTELASRIEAARAKIERALAALNTETTDDHG